jgi:hypothetical protein
MAALSRAASTPYLHSDRYIGSMTPADATSLRYLDASAANCRHRQHLSHRGCVSRQFANRHERNCR